MKVCTDACLFGAWVGVHAPEAITTSLRRGLDIGTGTGLLSLMLVQQTSLEMDAVDIDPGAVEQASRNVAASPWPDKIRILSGNVLTHHPNSPYDLVISNPPFFADDLKSPAKHKNLAKHEGDLSLDKLFTYTQKVISNEGMFALLLPARRAEEAKRLALTHGFTLLRHALVAQSVQHQPFRVMMLFTRSGIQFNKAPVLENIIIRDNETYSASFAELLRPFYLRC